MMGTRSLRRAYSFRLRWWYSHEIGAEVKRSLGSTRLKKKRVRKLSWEQLKEVREALVRESREDLVDIFELRALLVGMMACVAAVVGFGAAMQVPHVRARLLLGSGCAIALAFYGIALSSKGRGLRTSGAADRRLFWLDQRVPTRVAQKAVRAAVVRAANQVLGESAEHIGSRVAFPRDASRLVEMDPREIVLLRAHRDVARFVEQNDCCTIGISGGRGSGKTSLMLRLRRRHFGRGVVIRITTPTLRSPGELSRAVTLQLARIFAPTPVLRLHKLRWTIIAASGVALLGCGLAAAFLALEPGVRFVDWLGSVLKTTDGIALAAFVFGSVALGGIIAHLVDTIAAISTARGRANVPAIAILERHLNEIESSSVHGVSLGNPFGLSASRARKLRALPVSHTDVVEDFDRLVAAYRGTSKRKSVLVLIDELDRLPPEDVESALNEIKDFFHVDGVRVVVSVSDEALALFEARGVLPADVFDSSFDAVFRLARMSAGDSRAMLDHRVVGLPGEVALLCHAISAGRPRELLRTCRMLVDAVWNGREFESTRNGGFVRVGLVESVMVRAAAVALIGDMIREESHRLITSPFALEVQSTSGVGGTDALSQAGEPMFPSRRRVQALSLIRDHLVPDVAATGPGTGVMERFAVIASALADLMAAVKSEGSQWGEAFRRVQDVLESPVGNASA